jgi:hypothetical protein
MILVYRDRFSTSTGMVGHDTGIIGHDAGTVSYGNRP